jgi:hypothetical protein
MFTARINGLYLHDHGKIILFNSKNEIDYFVNQFVSYCINRSATDGFLDPFNIMSLGNNVVVEEWKEPKSCTCGTIKYDDLRR